MPAAGGKFLGFWRRFYTKNTITAGKIARRRRKFFEVSNHFYVRKHIFLKDFEYFMDENPQNFPPAAVVFPPSWGEKTQIFPPGSQNMEGKKLKFSHQGLEIWGKNNLEISVFPP